ncbi:MAG: hypothetical protein JNJ97_08785, partial [Alphaproteobacteria bacterium]|nr:hypothetical protein [Alphaproteobacteria bacterium]
LAIGKAGATNAGLLAAAVIALQEPKVALALDAYRAAQTAKVGKAPVDVAPAPKKKAKKRK